MKYTTIIIEDEKPAARRLERMLSEFSELEIVAVLYSVEESVEWLSKNEEPQLIFSDIVLGDGLSFDIFEKISIKSFIIYTTAFDQYTLKAFKLNSIDYLLKPIDKQEIVTAIEKFKNYMPGENLVFTNEIKDLLRKDKIYLRRVVVKVGYNLKVISTDEISCFYTENKIVYLQTEERSFPTDFTLEELENVLDEKTFFRVNRQFIIQLKFIRNIHTSPVYKVELTSQPTEEITISRDRIRDFKEWLAG